MKYFYNTSGLYLFNIFLLKKFLIITVYLSITAYNSCLLRSRYWYLEITMKKILFLSFFMALATAVNCQDFSADKLLNMLSFSVSKLESQLLDKRYYSLRTEFSGDTAIRTYLYRPVIKKKKQNHSNSRELQRWIHCPLANLYRRFIGGV